MLWLEEGVASAYLLPRCSQYPLEIPIGLGHHRLGQRH
jgi:hypothetical protein